MNNAKYPALSLAERDRRWALAKSLLREEGLECLIIFGSKGREQLDRYLTNDRSGGIVIYPLEGELVHLAWTVFDLASHMESSLRGEASWVSDMRVGASGVGIVDMLREKGYENAAIGVIGTQAGGPGEFEGWAPYATWKYVLDALPKARFRDVTVPFLERIWPKSAEELALFVEDQVTSQNGWTQVPMYGRLLLASRVSQGGRILFRVPLWTAALQGGRKVGDRGTSSLELMTALPTQSIADASMSR